MKVPFLICTAVLVATQTAPAVAQPVSLSLDPENIAGTTMQLPRGWRRQQDDYSLILSENDSDTSPVLMLIAVSVPAGVNLEPAQIADQVLTEMDLARHGIAEQRVEQRQLDSALYRLHRLDHERHRGYLASFTYTDAKAGALIHMMFSALEQRFVELGGPMLPLVVFGGLDVGVLDADNTPASVASTGDCDGTTSIEVCLAERWFGPGGQHSVGSTGSITAPYLSECERRQRSARTANETAAATTYCNQVYAIASRISAMNHRTNMSIAHNIGGGWCYRGESGCY